MKTVCNYSLIRFMPYPDTGEFVNLGIALLCPQIGFFGHLLETSKIRRVTQFFPELAEQTEIFRAGRKAVQDEMRRIHKVLHDRGAQDTQMILQPELANRTFASLLHAREGLFHYSPIRSVMADDPARCLRDLFEFYVNRNFTLHRDDEEEGIKRTIRHTLERKQLSGYFVRKVFEDDHVRVTVPFVHKWEDQSICGIRPMNLNFTETHDIVDKAMLWKSRIRRLWDIEGHPAEMLLVTRLPEGSGKRHQVASEMVLELDSIEGLQCLPVSEVDEILSFAKQRIMVGVPPFEQT